MGPVVLACEERLHKLSPRVRRTEKEPCVAWLVLGAQFSRDLLRTLRHDALRDLWSGVHMCTYASVRARVSICEGARVGELG